MYLRSHGDLDQGHIRFFRDLVDSLEDEEDRRAVLHVAKRVYVLYGDVLRTVPRSGAASEAGARPAIEASN